MPFQFLHRWRPWGIIVPVLALLSSHSGLGAEPIPWPDVMIMPVETPGLDQDFTRRHPDVLTLAVQLLTQEWIQGAKPLNQLSSQPNNTPLNLKRATDKIHVGPRRQGPSYPLLLQPIVCEVADRIVFALEAASPEQNLLLASAHTAILWHQADEPLHPETTLSVQATDIWRRLSQATVQKLPGNLPSPDHAMTLGEGLLKNNNHQSAGSSQCLNMLLAATILSEGPIQRTLGNNSLITAHRFLNQPVLMKRASRQISLDWDMQTKGKVQTLPWSGQLSWRLSDSVFGQRIADQQTAPITVNNSPNGLILTVPDRLLQTIKLEENSLRMSDKPAVAKIDRAWVYLDRGRAWGLEMNDRLITRIGNEIVKGHVVGYYGPGLKIKSPRGFPVQEGAIVFIRKGQRKTKIGQEFDFDPTRFPTAWPPKPTP